MATQNTSSLISKIYKSRNVVLELMEKQDYNVIDYKGFSINEINTMKINNQLDMILEKNLENDSNNNQEKKKENLYKILFSKSFKTK